MENETEETEEKEEEVDEGHTITIAKKGAEKYVYAIVRSLQPLTYDRYNEIKINVTEFNLERAELVLSLLKNLWIEEVDRKKVKREIVKEDGTSYTLEVIEITIKKHPKLRH